jgi:hypothetical protein
VRDYDPEDPEDADGGEPGEADQPDEPDNEPGFYLSEDDEYDDLTMESLFLPVTSLWRVLGAIDDDERLTALGWWGLPEAMLGSGPNRRRAELRQPRRIPDHRNVTSSWSDAPRCGIAVVLAAAGYPAGAR